MQNHLKGHDEMDHMPQTVLTTKALAGEISSELDRTKKMMENLNIIQISHLTFDCS